MSFLLPRIPHSLRSVILSCTPRSSTPMDSPSEGLVIGDHSVPLREESGLVRSRGLVTIDILPDDVLIEIFNFYIDINDRDWYFSRRNMWHVLVHVCRRWRYLVFALPRHLSLQLKYNGHRPMSEVLGAWPVLPLILISDHVGLYHPKSDEWWDNRAVALESEHYKRFCEIHITDMTKFRWERFIAAMQKPFPELTALELKLYDNLESVLPDSFLGGSAPRLRELFLRNTPFPSIPKLLLSANGLVTLRLWEISHSWYISSDAMATALTVMTRLETLDLWFDLPRSRPDPASRPLPPPTRFVLPALTNLAFLGVYEYLEDFLARIDVPLLYDLYITFFMDQDFDVPQLHRLIDQTEVFKTFAHAEVSISVCSTRLEFYPQTGAVDHRMSLKLRIIEGWLDWQPHLQLWGLTQICNSSFLLISALEKLRIQQDEGIKWHGQDGMMVWLRLLGPLTALKNLYLDQGITRSVCAALKEHSGERETEVLPALRNIFVPSALLQPIREAMIPFIDARQLSGHPVTIDGW